MLQDVGYIVLCPEKEAAGLAASAKSIRYYSQNRDILAVVGGDATAAEVKILKEICPTHKGKATFSSLINVGMKKLKNEWGFLLFAGSRINLYLEKKLGMFAKSEKDVIYPVVEKHCDFVGGSFNGVLINRKFYEEVGEFPDLTLGKDGINDFELVKLFWAMDAIAKGATFKGIVGMKII